MEVRAIRDLAQRSDNALFADVAEGLELVVRNVGRLFDGAEALTEAKQFHAGRVLAKIAEEEAAKFLILLDAVRCPRKDSGRFAGQLRRFNDHLAKGLYAKACMYKPTTLEQLQEYVNLDRAEFYLDGPNGVDWIFRNEVIDGREGVLYVDYVRHDDGHRWADPTAFEDLLFGVSEPSAVRTARLLHGVGMAAPAALATVAELWRTTPLEPTTHCTTITALNHKTLQLLESRGQLREQPADAYRWICSDWQFPMYDLDLSPIKVDRNALRDQQRRWSPEDY